MAGWDIQAIFDAPGFDIDDYLLRCEIAHFDGPEELLEFDIKTDFRYCPDSELPF